MLTSSLLSSATHAANRERMDSGHRDGHGLLPRPIAVIWNRSIFLGFLLGFLTACERVQDGARCPLCAPTSKYHALVGGSRGQPRAFLLMGEVSFDAFIAAQSGYRVACLARK